MNFNYLFERQEGKEILGKNGGLKLFV